MDSKLNALFYVGILVPTTITIGFFIGFLTCWFRCDLKKRLLAYRTKTQHKYSTYATTEKEGDVGENVEKASQHSADSAIDVNELEMAATEGKGKVPLTNQAFCVSHLQNQPVTNFCNINAVQLAPLPSVPVLTEAEVHKNLSRGFYPSREKLNEEIHSEPRIYESQEDIELAIYNDLAAPSYASIDTVSSNQDNVNHSFPPLMFNRTRQSLYSSAPRLLLEKRPSYSSSMGPIEDNHMTDYGFVPWQQRPNSVCGDSILASRMIPKTSLSIPKQPQYTHSNIAWNTKFLVSSTDNLAVQILHV